MNRQTLAIQAQANKYIELEKLGFNADQRAEFKDWLNACEAHQTAYQESKHVDVLLAQFNESELTTESNTTTMLKPQSEHTRTTERTGLAQKLPCHCRVLCAFIYKRTELSLCAKYVFAATLCCRISINTR